MAVSHPNGAVTELIPPFPEDPREGPRTTGLLDRLSFDGPLAASRDGGGPRGQHAPRDLERGIDVAGRYIEVRHGAKARRVAKVTGHAQPLRGAGLLERARV